MYVQQFKINKRKTMKHNRICKIQMAKNSINDKMLLSKNILISEKIINCIQYLRKHQSNEKWFLYYIWFKIEMNGKELEEKWSDPLRNNLGKFKSRSK